MAIIKIIIQTMSAVDLYIKTLYDKYKFLATWLPNDTISIGDYGIISNNLFQKMGSLKDFNIQFNEIRSDSPVDLSLHYETNIEYTNNLSVKTNLPEVLKIGNGKANFKFGKEGAFTFDALECYTYNMDSRGIVGEKIKEIYKTEKGKWNKKWYVIDRLIKVKSATILVSNTNQSSLELDLQAKLPALNLADSNVSFNIRSEQGEIIKILSSDSITPLFMASKLKNSFFGGLIKSDKNMRFGGDTSQVKKIDVHKDNFPFWETYSLDE